MGDIEINLFGRGKACFELLDAPMTFELSTSIIPSMQVLFFLGVGTERIDLPVLRFDG